jgi:GMP synthase-like glutamine amidotransferase
VSRLVVPEGKGTNNRYCYYEPIRSRIAAARVLLVDNLVADVAQYSEEARQQPDFDAVKWVRLERFVASLALANIEKNVRVLVRRPEVLTIQLADLDQPVVAEFDPDAIILSGTLRDFDLYAPSLIDRFNRFIRETTVPVIGICGGHQLIGQAFGAAIVTLDGLPPRARRNGRLLEYQYRFVKITELGDPIFSGIDERPDPRWQRYSNRRHLLRVWQNHGLQIDRLPDGFTKLARGYLTEVQMMVRRDGRQLIYGTQFHLEKSFQDWQADKYWDHRNESRDGRLLFENFLIEALNFRGREWRLNGNDGSGPIMDEPAGSSFNLPTTGF